VYDCIVYRIDQKKHALFCPRNLAPPALCSLRPFTLHTHTQPVRMSSIRILHTSMDVLASVAAAVAIPDPPPSSPLPSPYTRLTPEQRWTCVVLHKHGWKKRRIADDLQCDRHTVSAVLRRFRLSGDVCSGKRKGRPRCTDEGTDLAIAVTARIDVFTSPRQVRRKLNLDCSRLTIDRRMQEAGLFGRVARHKRDYSEAERRKRLSFANGYKDWTEAQWEKVLFSDEKCFYGKGFCGRMWVRREKGTALDPQYTIHKTAHPVKVNVWGCFCAAGQGYSHIFNDNMDAALMKNILSANLIPSAQLHFSFDPPEPWFLLHDNDKKFTSRLVQGWLHEAGVTTLEFPPYSPDLNPIENLWGVCARAVEQKACETMLELQDVVADVWKKLDVDTMRTLAHSMPQRCKAVIEAEGWHTKY
jgi:DDE superfamily endonuclease/transposase/Homeodomain-like domain-containing protein